MVGDTNLPRIHNNSMNSDWLSMGQHNGDLELF